MRPETIALLRCPSCGDALELCDHETESNRIESGTLYSRDCARRFSIENGIARLLPNLLETESAEAKAKRSEMAARDAQVGDYDKMRGLALFGKIEIPVTLRQINLLPNTVLLEAGCGTGRMTTVFAAKCRSVLAADFSFESLRVCHRKLQQAGIANVDLVQADVCALPFAPEIFDRTVSCQVLEHLPTAESRTRMISELARVTRTGGRVVLSAYQYNLFMRLFGKKEGEHTGGIYYYRFTRQELHTLLSSALEVQGMTGTLLYHYLARCVKKAA